VINAVLSATRVNGPRLKSLTVDTFGADETIEDLGVTPNFLEAISSIPDLTLQGQFGFCNPICCYKPPPSLESIVLGDCAVRYDTLQAFIIGAISRLEMTCLGMCL
jgi:hypothetical protein